MNEKLKKILIASIDLKGLANGLVDEVLEEALKKIVADSSNTVDDMLMAAIYPVLEAELKKVIEAKLDLEKMLMPEPMGTEAPVTNA